MSDNIVSGNKFAFGDPLSASVGVNFNLTVTMPDAYALAGKWATLTVSKFEDGPELFKLSEAGGGLTFSGQNIPVVINNDATNETAGGDTWHTLIESYRNLRFSLDVGDDSDTSNAEYRFQGDISTDPRRGVLPTGLEIGETVTPTLGGTTVEVSLLGTGAPGPVGPSGADGADSTVPGPVGPSGADGSVNDGATTDINGVVFGDGAQLSAATASEIRIAADLDTSDSPTFSGLTLSGNINLSDGLSLAVDSGSGLLEVDGKLKVDEGLSITQGKPLVFNGATTLNATSGYSIVKSGARLEFRTTNSYPFFAVSHFTAVIGATSTLTFSSNQSAAGSRDVGLSRASAGHLQLGNGTLNDTSGTLSLSDLIATGDITLSDGSIITVGDGTGKVTIDGVLEVEEELAVGSGKQLVFDGNLNSVNYSIVKSGSRLEFRTTDSNPVLCLSNHRVVVGGDNTMGFSSNDSAAGTPDTAFSRASAGHLQLGNGTVNDSSGTLSLSDLIATGDITQGGNAVLDESYFTPQTLTDGATIAYDVSNGVNAKVTLGGDRTLAAITNAAEGQSGSLTVIQDATGGRALTLDASQTDMLGTLADIAGMGANEECEIAWRKTDYTNCKLWITIPA